MRRWKLAQSSDGNPLGQPRLPASRPLGEDPTPFPNRSEKPGHDVNASIALDAAMKSAVGTELAKILLQNHPSRTITQDLPPMSDPVSFQQSIPLWKTFHPILFVDHPAAGAEGEVRAVRAGTQAEAFRWVIHGEQDPGCHTAEAAGVGAQMVRCRHAQCLASIADDLFASSE